MTRESLENLESILGDLIVERKRLGYFDANSETILITIQSLYEVVSHLLEEATKKRDTSTQKQTTDP